MRVPEVRNRLYELATDLGVPELKTLADELKRRPPASKAAPTSRPMTRFLAILIARYIRKHPDISNRDVGRVFHVDGGRVSEIRAGKRR